MFLHRCLCRLLLANDLSCILPLFYHGLFLLAQSNIYISLLFPRIILDSTHRFLCCKIKSFFQAFFLIFSLCLQIFVHELMISRLKIAILVILDFLWKILSLYLSDLTEFDSQELMILCIQLEYFSILLANRQAHFQTSF